MPFLKELREAVPLARELRKAAEGTAAGFESAAAAASVLAQTPSPATGAASLPPAPAPLSSGGGGGGERPRAALPAEDRGA